MKTRCFHAVTGGITAIFLKGVEDLQGPLLFALASSYGLIIHKI